MHKGQVIHNRFGNEFKMESFLILLRMILMLNRMISLMLRITKMVDDIIFMDVSDDAKNAFVDADMDGEISMEKGCSLPHSWKLGTVSSSITWKQNFKSNVINLLLKSVCSPFCQILSLVAWFSPTTTSKFVVLQILRYRETSCYQSTLNCSRLPNNNTVQSINTEE